jgi:serine/threonine-protein kinase
MNASVPPPIAPLSWREGDLVGKYRLLSRLAIGGMAEIWLALQTGPMGFGKLVVVKRVSDAYAPDPASVQMFLDEARIAAQLRHRNLVQVFDLGEHGGGYYQTMEYLHGEDLGSVVRGSIAARRPLPLGFSARVLASAAEGLASAHEHVGLDGKPLQVVHRDVSPSNIFVTYDGAVKVLDFGVALAANRLQPATESGQVKGKVGYMSPEQLLGNPVDQRTDVWALGVVLFEACTGSRLFETGGRTIAAMEKILHRPIPLARERNPEIPEELEGIIASAVERDLERRTPTARALHQGLETWLKTLSDAPTSSGLAATMRALFADRLEQKQALLESARTGDLEAVKQVTVRMRSPRVERPSASRRRWVGPAAGAGLVAALALAAPGAIRALSGTRTAELRVSSSRTGTDVFLDGRKVGVTPLTLESVAQGEHTVWLDNAGRTSAPRSVTLERGQMLAVELIEAPPEPPPPAAVAVAPSAAPPPDPQPAPPANAAPVRRSEAAKAAPKGQLTLDTTPWTTVYLGGHLLGHTPLVESALPAGHHELKLVNEEKGLKRVIDVQINPGRTTVLRLSL